HPRGMGRVLPLYRLHGNCIPAIGSDRVLEVRALAWTEISSYPQNPLPAVGPSPRTRARQNLGLTGARRSRSLQRSHTAATGDEPEGSVQMAAAARQSVYPTRGKAQHLRIALR